jgi:predicted Zn-dependent protease
MGERMFGKRIASTLATAALFAMSVHAVLPPAASAAPQAQPQPAPAPASKPASSGASSKPANNAPRGRPSKGERENSRKYHEQIIRAFGVYEDQALQDYVSEVGQRVARNSDLPDEEFKFVVLDDGEINAFTTGCCYVYLNRGLLLNLNSEAELASVLGHEIAHVTARHPSKRQTRGAIAGIGAMAAAILTGSGAVADLANLGAQAWMQGYGREGELEADRLGLLYSTRTGYRPEAMGSTFNMFRQGERFERDRARAEGREPRIYHGMFSSHPAPDKRVFESTKAAAKINGEPPGGWIDNREQYLRRIDGLSYGSSRAQGIVRENRFYHADLGVTLAFPRGWTIDNQRDRLIAFTPNKDTYMQVTAEAVPPTQTPREFLITLLRKSGHTIARGEALTSNDMEGYSALTSNGSPIDGGAGPVRWTMLYRGKQAYVFAGASRSSRGAVPEADGLFQSVAGTLRGLKPAEFPLAEPYRLRVKKATDTTRLDDYVADMPTEKFQRETLLLLNGLYPDKALQAGDFYKVVE